MPKSTIKIEVHVKNPSTDAFEFAKTITSHNCGWLMNSQFGRNKAKDGRYSGWHIKVDGAFHELPAFKQDAGKLGACEYCQHQFACLGGNVVNFSAKQACLPEGALNS